MKKEAYNKFLSLFKATLEDAFFKCGWVTTGNIAKFLRSLPHDHPVNVAYAAYIKECKCNPYGGAPNRVFDYADRLVRNIHNTGVAYERELIGNRKFWTMGGPVYKPVYRNIFYF